MKVLFRAPNHDAPSWGIGMISHLADITIQLGLDACILKLQNHTQAPPWLPIRVKQEALSTVVDSLSSNDIIVVPDFMVAEGAIRDLKVQKICFVQGSVMIPLGLKAHPNFQALGFGLAIMVLAHIRKAIERFWPIETAVVSPFP